MASLPLTNLTKRRNVWFARLLVPVDVQAAMGAKVLILTTQETDPAKAAVKAKPILARWKQQIAEAREGTQATVHRDVLRMASAVRNAERNGQDPETALRVAVDFVVKHYGPKVEPAALARAVKDKDGDEVAAIVSLLPSSEAVVDAILGRRTPFLSWVDAWAGGLDMKPRQAGEYRSNVEWFGTDRTIEGLTGRVVQDWINGRAEAGDAAATIRRRLASVRNYWLWLQRHGHVAEDFQPFDKRTIPADKKGAKVVRKAFMPAEVVALHAAALAKKDKVLADLISVAQYTGGRIEELCSLQAKDVVGDTIHLSSKTEAGDRLVPVVPALAPILARMEKAAKGPQRFLIASTAANKNEERAAPLSKRFGRLKTGEGFGPEHVFHSIRKTVASLLQTVGCPEPIAADIIGHELETMTYGLYSTGSDMQDRRQWLEKAVARYPAAAA